MQQSIFADAETELKKLTMEALGETAALASLARGRLQWVKLLLGTLRVTNLRNWP